MPRYMVERSLPGITAEALQAAAQRAKTATAAMTEEGRPVRYLRSTYIPDEEKCFCLFEADDPIVVEEAQHREEIPFDRVVEAVLIAADDLPVG